MRLHRQAGFAIVFLMLTHLTPSALITGAGRRIGRAIALDMAANGWSVAVHYHHSAGEAENTVSDIAHQGGRAIALAADLALESETIGLIARAAEHLGPITCLINNASIFEYDSVETATAASWHDHLAINLRAPFVLTQALVRQLPEGQEGNVVNILDQRVWNLTPHFTSYTISKAALWTLTQTSALALAPRARVNAIGPGPTLQSRRQTASDFEAQWQATPLRRQVNAEEICQAVQFILNSPSLTGQMIALDAGQHLGWVHPTFSQPRE